MPTKTTTQQERFDKLKHSTTALHQFLQQPPEFGLSSWWAIFAGFAESVYEDLETVGPDRAEAKANTCRTQGCANKTDDGEGYDGFCGTCADKLEQEGEQADTRRAEQQGEIEPG